MFGGSGYTDEESTQNLFAVIRFAIFWTVAIVSYVGAFLAYPWIRIPLICFFLVCFVAFVTRKLVGRFRSC